MSGIYVHIPFCKQACHYCDFHFSTSLGSKEELLIALAKEAASRKEYLENEIVQTLYLGGGTPSLLTESEILRFTEAIRANFELDSNLEFTLEANPDDLNSTKIRDLKGTEINRLSIGVQSFFDQHLHWMNRAHSAKEADYSIKDAQDKGFDNITIDLIYGIPGMKREEWQYNVQKAIDLGVPHISAYCLTIEPKTVFGHRLQKGELPLTPDTESEYHYFYLVEKLCEAGFQHYEVSNFCKPGFESKHNQSYWEGKKYLGLGPSSHSFNGSSRQWNVANNSLYIRGIQSGKEIFEREELTDAIRINEHLLTGLRTAKGADAEWLKAQFDYDILQLFPDRIEQLSNENKLIVEKGKLSLTTKGLLFADGIASDFFTE